MAAGLVPLRNNDIDPRRFEFACLLDVAAERHHDDTLAVRAIDYADWITQPGDKRWI